MIRELLYVDVSRVRSLLAQLDGGVVENAIERTAQHRGGRLGASVLGVQGEMGGERVVEAEESRTMQDTLFAVFDEVGSSLGIIRDIDPEDFNSIEHWESSIVHQSLSEGEIVRIFLPILITDPVFVRSRLARFAELGNAFRAMQMASVDKQVGQLETTGKQQLQKEMERFVGSRDKRKVAEREAERKLQAAIAEARATAESALDAVNMQEIEPIFPVIEGLLTSDAISVRFLGCGDREPRYSLVGSLLGRDDYIQRERDALYSRYGSLLQGWTAVVQIATLPQRSDESSAPRSLDVLDFAAPGGIDRAAVEQSVMNLLAMMEGLGVSEGPRWPSISVIPLAIYRTVPRSGGHGEHS